MTQQVERFFSDYLAAYFGRRDLEALTRMLLPNASGSGTGRDEISFGDGAFSRLFSRDIEQAPNAVDYAISQQQVSCLDERCAVVFAVMDISTTIAGQRLVLHSLRMTLVVARNPHGEFRIEHLHVSLPTTEHGGGEAFPVKELEERNSVLTRLVAERTKALSDSLEENGRLLLVDKLTGLCNRRMLDQCLQREVQRSERYPTPFSVIFLDIDHFKSVNDDHGHLAGDRFLVGFAALVARRLRKTDQFGRWGGEEFLIVCSNTGIDEAALLAEAIRADIETADFGLAAAQTVSAGVTAHRPGDDEARLIQRADRMLYTAKQRGRNRICRSDREASA